jgi:hypothetical protein
LSHPTSPFILWWGFQDRVLQTICSGWLQSAILLISASWVARITGMSNQHLAKCNSILWTPLSDIQLYFLGLQKVALSFKVYYVNRTLNVGYIKWI